MTRIICLLLLLVAGCSDQDSGGGTASPVTLNSEALGHYCQMNVMDHDGPKAQVHLAGNQHPIWFVQVRDALAFDRMPEQSAQVAAIFVNDMGAPGADWEQPGADNWILASNAYYVVGSDRRGGMGASEFIPFSEQSAALRFSKLYGGKVIHFTELADEAVLAPEDVELPSVTRPVAGGS
jgi:copper chaperone NosL